MLIIFGTYEAIHSYQGFPCMMNTIPTISSPTQCPSLKPEVNFLPSHKKKEMIIFTLFFLSLGKRLALMFLE